MNPDPAAGRRSWFFLLLAALVLGALVVALLVFWKASREEIIDCANYDSQVWAQSVYDTDPTRYAALDPDSNGLACEELPHGVAPALWTNEVPRAAEQAALISVSDGDTIRVDVGGREEMARLILIDHRVYSGHWRSWSRPWGHDAFNEHAESLAIRACSSEGVASAGAVAHLA
jgi:hypothetical protein